MGAVYLAEDLSLGRRCAIKENVPDPNASPQGLAQMRQQFQAEGKASWPTWTTPTCPECTDYFSFTGNEYIVMEYVEGENLHSLQQRQGGPLPEQVVLVWADQVLDRADLSPQPAATRSSTEISNRRTSSSRPGKVKLVDFGLVKLLDPNDPRTATAMKGMGTPEYAPLEQYAGGQGHTDARTDIYSLGGTLYHLLTGAHGRRAPAHPGPNPAGAAAATQPGPVAACGGRHPEGPGGPSQTALPMGAVKYAPGADRRPAAGRNPWTAGCKTAPGRSRAEAIAAAGLA